MSAIRHDFHNGRVMLHQGDCLAVLDGLADNSIDSVVCDPPYHLTSIVKRFGAGNAAPAKVGATGAYARASSGFMGKQWDGGDIAFRVELWAKVWRVLKPGGHLVAFSGTRTYHRMAVAIEDAGFEIRDMLQWLYGSGFPKSHDVSKGIDKAAGAEREVAGVAGRSGSSRSCMAGDFTGGEYYVTNPSTVEAAKWQGWGTALKPACEPVCFARKPLSENTIAANVLAHGVGAINIDACRVQFAGMNDAAAAAAAAVGFAESRKRGTTRQSQSIGKESRDGTNTYDPFAINGRWPANVIHDGSDEVVGAFPERDGATSNGKSGVNEIYGGGWGKQLQAPGYADSGSAARFFYSAKADANDRLNSKHPTVKPVDLMRWLVRLVTPKGGTVLDPFAGTGTTGAAAFLEGFNAVLIERESEYVADITRRMDLLLAGPDEKARALTTPESADTLPLFGGAA
jgi:DNA modification methylase